ncbi:MAG: hypothetical protein HYY20_12030 [Candidatus Tectomicrobia bacterium]|uniref:Uncharacterized protein n=1 Tax=Tectimicrobiota bacterium TaxID=2528274 RepID=A0A932CQK8_UNCTE|nr:hypothetical protein [Candidatus Tectomicrobia bacterium]
MRPAEKLFNELEAKANAGRVRVIEADVRIAAEVADFDRLGLAIHRLEIEGASLPGRLGRLAEEIPMKLTYLLEPLALIEREEGEPFLLIRSVPPHRQEASIDYYEIRLSGGGPLSLERYGYQRSQRIRERTPMLFTREVFGRLLDDLVGLMAA